LRLPNILRWSIAPPMGLRYPAAGFQSDQGAVDQYSMVLRRLIIRLRKGTTCYTHMIRTGLPYISCLFVFFVNVLHTAPVWAGYEEGYRAWKAQHLEEAFEELMPLAKRGHIGAQVIIGTLYENGKGVGEDQSQAVYWFTLAAERGHS
jgi:TPR repeat protein